MRLDFTLAERKLFKTREATQFVIIGNLSNDNEQSSKRNKNKDTLYMCITFWCFFAVLRKKKTTLSDQIKGRVENVSTGWKIFFFFHSLSCLGSYSFKFTTWIFPSHGKSWVSCSPNNVLLLSSLLKFPIEREQNTVFWYPNPPGKKKKKKQENIAKWSLQAAALSYFQVTTIEVLKCDSLQTSAEDYYNKFSWMIFIYIAEVSLQEFTFQSEQCSRTLRAFTHMQLAGPWITEKDNELLFFDRGT